MSDLPVTNEAMLLITLDNAICDWVAEKGYGPGQTVSESDLMSIRAAIAWLDKRWND